MPGRWTFEAIYAAGIASTMWDRDAPDAALVRWAGEATRAVDLGCGTGTHALWLAHRGVRVDAVDFSSRAVSALRRRARDARLDLGVEQADVLRWRPSAPYDLVVDYGCFHSLPIEARARYAEVVAEAAAPGATFVLMAMSPRWPIDWRLLGPHHVRRRDVRAVFAGGFTLEEVDEAPTYWTDAPWIYRPLSGPYRPLVYRFSRRR
ncbi:MAG: class I SAM-dependent methyltransferase [Sandaracinaceae bacterium]